MLDKSQQPDLDVAIEYLKSIRPSGPWNLTAIVPAGPVSSATFTDAGKARAWLAKHAGRANLHYTANPASTPTGKSGRAQKADIEMIEFLHGDFDLDKLPDGAPLAFHPMHTRKAIIADDMELGEMVPTLLVDSGGGLQGLWRLADPLPATPDNIEWAEAPTAGWQTAFPVASRSAPISAISCACRARSTISTHASASAAARLRRRNWSDRATSSTSAPFSATCPRPRRRLSMSRSDRPKR